MRSRSREDRAAVEANLTSLIDVTFLLIVFFVLVSKVNEIENIDLNLPSPADPSTEVVESDRMAVINVLPGAGGAIQGYRVGVTDFPADSGGIEAMTAHLATLYQANPRLDVNIRADRHTHYEHVEAALSAVSTAARSAPARSVAGPRTAHVNLAVVRDR